MDSEQPHAAQERLTRDFRRFNLYASKALELDADAEVYASLAVAYELSQLRFQLMKHTRLREDMVTI